MPKTYIPCGFNVFDWPTFRIQDFDWLSPLFFCDEYRFKVGLYQMLV